MEKVGGDEPAVQFSEINHHTALQEITLRAAQETESDLRVPKKKPLVIRSTMTEQPTKIAPNPLDAEFIVIACRMKVDFAQRTLTMQFPFEDWLLKPPNERTLSRLQQSTMYESVSETVLNLVVDLGPSSDHDVALEDLHLMGEVGERLGLAGGMILRIADSVNRIWHADFSAAKKYYQS